MILSSIITFHVNDRNVSSCNFSFNLLLRFTYNMYFHTDRQLDGLYFFTLIKIASLSIFVHPTWAHDGILLLNEYQDVEWIDQSCSINQFSKTVFQYDSTNLHYHQWCRRVLLCPHLIQTVIFFIKCSIYLILLEFTCTRFYVRLNNSLCLLTFYISSFVSYSVILSLFLLDYIFFLFN